MLRRRIEKEFEALEREIDEFIDEVFGRPMWNPTLKCLEPLAHIRETEEKFIITADLPYVKKEDIKLDLTPTELKIEAKMQRHVIYDLWGTVQRRCAFQNFSKEIRFPSEVVPEATRARFKDGFLVIDIPKKKQRYKIGID